MSIYFTPHPIKALWVLFLTMTIIGWLGERMDSRRNMFRLYLRNHKVLDVNTSKGCGWGEGVYVCHGGPYSNDLDL